MKQAYEEVKLALNSEKHKYLSEDTLQLCLEALREHEETKHNGMSNYPTWSIAALIDNNENLYNKYWKLVKEMQDTKQDDYNIIGVLAQTIEADFTNECEKIMKNIPMSPWASILNHVNKDLINYREIAKSFIS